MEEREFGSWPAAVDRDSMVLICGERPYRTTQRLIGIASGQAAHALPGKGDCVLRAWYV